MGTARRDHENEAEPSPGHGRRPFCRLRTYTARDLADMLGITIETFYERREAMHRDDRLPRPLIGGGRHRFDRRSIDAWMQRFHPNHAAAAAAANDAAPPPPPASDEQWRAHLAQQNRARIEQRA
jgi:predicted DNA-binding transcriptional regulator AlpA